MVFTMTSNEIKCAKFKVNRCKNEERWQGEEIESESER
jgi:hypothetical protein